MYIISSIAGMWSCTGVFKYKYIWPLQIQILFPAKYLHKCTLQSTAIIQILFDGSYYGDSSYKFLAC